MDVPEYVDLDGCARLVGMTARQLKRLVRDGRFPAPAGRDGASFWSSEDVWRWAALQGGEVAANVPLDFWPDAVEPAPYLGPRSVGDDVVLAWQTAQGVVGIIWRPEDPIMLPLTRLARELNGYAVVVKVMPDFGIDGPGVQAANCSRPDDVDDLRWRDLARVLGQPVPYWPRVLRLPELLTAWRPGDRTVVAPARPPLDTTVLLRLAAMFPSGHATHRTLLELARTAQRGATQDAQMDLRILAQATARFANDGVVTTAIAAEPLAIDGLVDNDEELDETTRRIGWLELLDRSDVLSRQCVREVLSWDGGSALPYSNPEEVDPGSDCGREWVTRLEPAERTAGFEQIDYDGGSAAFRDPVTGAPAVRKSDGRWLTTIPQRLAATSPLAEVILDELIWVRTADGVLYPAPKHHYFGLNWGYGGSGPGSLALLIHRLLDDINAAAADSTSGAAEGLDALTEQKWPRGTVLTRQTLEAARDGRPYRGPIDDG